MKLKKRYIPFMNNQDESRMIKKTFLTHSEKGTFDLAEKMAREFRGDEVILLSGVLGAGKTVFTKGLCSGLGLEDVNQVCSPSYTLVNIYKGRFPIYHMDFYRLGENEDPVETGWEDTIGAGVIIVEWGEKITVEFSCIRIEISIVSNESREIVVMDTTGILRKVSLAEND